MIPGNINTDLISGDEGGYQISRSLRFNSADSAYLSRTPASAGNRKTWTWAGWVKNTCSTATTIPVTLLSARNGAGAGIGEFFWLAINNIFTADGHQIAAGDGNVNYLVSTASFRDPSAWYHIVCAYDSTQATADNRLRLYVNGTEITVFNTNNRASLTQNSDGVINRTSIEHRMGLRISEYSNCYLADVHFIDGQALTPSSFTEVSATTGQLIPKQYTGSFGTNGFWLKFSDNSAATATTLGKDYSGNGNNWTPNNLSVTAGAGNDSLVDTPTSYGTDTGAGGEVRGNYCTFNPIDNPEALVYTNGNLDATVTPIGTYDGGRANFGLTSGKWYFELVSPNADLTDDVVWVGLAKSTATFGSTDSNFYLYYNWNGNKVSGTSAAYGATWTANDVIGVAFNADTGKLWFSKNGTWQASGDPAAGTNEAFSGLTSGPYFPAIQLYKTTALTASLNFGQRPFAYTAPSGFKALCDTNLPAPTIAKPNTAMDVALYTGTGSALTATSALGFSPDLVWIKGRSGATDHALYDTVRGTTLDLVSNSTAAETTQAQGLTAFNSNGFTVGTLAKLNTNTATYAGWCWDAGSSTVTNTAGTIASQVRANPSAGFSVVTWNYNGTNATVGHGLGVAPGMIIAKRRDNVSNWFIYHSGIGPNAYMYLDSTAAQITNITGVFDGNSSTVFEVNNGLFPGATATYVAYCFAPVAGYSAFGSYTGNGSADGPFVYTGFRPRWVMVKATSGATQWFIYDAARSPGNISHLTLLANSSAGGNTYEGMSISLPIDILSNGFKLRYADAGGYTNYSTWNYVYAAFAENPFQYARAR